MAEFGRFVKKLKDTPEPTGKGNMLDNTLAMHGSASSSFHLSRNYPIVSAGGSNLGFNNGRYLQYVNLLEDGSLPGAGVISDSGWRGTAKEEISRWAICSSASSSASASRPIPSPDARAR